MRFGEGEMARGTFFSSLSVRVPKLVWEHPPGAIAAPGVHEDPAPGSEEGS